MSRVKKEQDAPIGQDSFLDIVSNLVGILIILVMIVGARAKDAMLEASQSSETAAQGTGSAVRSEDVASAERAEHDVEQDIHRIDRQMKQQADEIMYRESERNRSQLLVTAAEQSLTERRAELDEGQRDEFDRRNKLAAASEELSDLHSGISFLESVKPTTAIIEHLPTPMAKTVFGQELHMRLAAGRVALIPWDEFLQLLKNDAPQKVWRLKDQNDFTELIGPLGGFWMKYTLKRQSQVMQTKVGVAMQQSVVLDRFVLLPESPAMGEPAAEALGDGAQLWAALRGHRPEATTITIWTYPDSFNEFRELKKELFRRGYVTAARPLPADQPIGGSPDGTRSSAQ